jgi:hypothetical protein
MKIWAPAVFTPRKDPEPTVEKAGCAPEPVWIGTENRDPPGFDPRTFQSVASRYTDYAIPALSILTPEQLLLINYWQNFRDNKNVYFFRIFSRNQFWETLA